MKIATFERRGEPGTTSWGVLVSDDRMADLPMLGRLLSEDVPPDVLALLREARIDEVRALLERAEPGVVERASVPLGSLRLLPPIDRPGKIIAIGRNYQDHAAEADLVLPTWPKIFPKFPSTMVGHEDAVLLPSISREVDFEVEVAVVIGRRARDVSIEDAADFIAGYTVVNDISARDIQFADEQLALGKNFDTFCPIGPWITTTDELPDPDAIGLSLRLNGELMQSSTTANLIFSIRYLISFLSYVAALEPGDVIVTGTPAGVGCFREPPIWLGHGDLIESTVDGIGTLVNRVEEPVDQRPAPASLALSGH